MERTNMSVPVVLENLFYSIKNYSIILKADFDAHIVYMSHIYIEAFNCMEVVCKFASSE